MAKRSGAKCAKASMSKYGTLDALPDIRRYWGRGALYWTFASFVWRGGRIHSFAMKPYQQSSSIQGLGLNRQTAVFFWWLILWSAVPGWSNVPLEPLITLYRFPFCQHSTRMTWSPEMKKVDIFQIRIFLPWPYLTDIWFCLPTLALNLLFEVNI